MFYSGFAKSTNVLQESILIIKMFSHFVLLLQCIILGLYVTDEESVSNVTKKKTV